MNDIFWQLSVDSLDDLKSVCINFDEAELINHKE